jgi:hypothetical protein
MPRRFSENTICVGLFIVSVVANLVFSSVGLRHSLLEVHDFRQVQTALTTRYLQEEGWSLAYPTPLFGPPWSAPMEFPFYQMGVARFGSLTGLPLEPAGRLVALGFLYLALPAWFGLAGLLGLPPARRWLLLSLILLSPVYLYYSRSFMIESTTLCASAWFLLAYCRALERRRAAWLAAAMVFGAIAALAKVTTLIVFLVPAVVFTCLLLWRASRPAATSIWPGVQRIIASGLAAVAPAVIIGAAWVRFSDSIKATNPLTRALMSGSMSLFNFGTLGQRLSGSTWEQIFRHTSVTVLPSANVALMAVFALILGRTHRARSLILVLSFLAGPLIFTNLYFVHDYYFYANGVFLLGALVLAWSQILDLEAFSLGARWAAVGASLCLQVFSYSLSYLQVQRKPLHEPPELGAILAAATHPDDVLLIYGYDWEAHVSYFAHRRAVMIVDNRILDIQARDEVLGRIAPGRVTALVVMGEMRKDPGFFKPLIQRLRLHPAVVLLSDDSVLYLAESRLNEALPRLEAMSLSTFHFGAPAPIDEGVVSRMRYLTAALKDKQLVAMMHPAPLQIIHPFGLALHTVEGRTVFNAHAPTDLIFGIPAQATQITADYGVLPDAYAGKNETDGMEFRVEIVRPDGARTTIASVYLDPQRRAGDRGTRQMNVPLPAGTTGEIWLRTLPGPAGSMACDWAYWAKIEIR